MFPEPSSEHTTARRPSPYPGAADALVVAALAQLAEGVILTDAGGRIIFVNRAALALHGVARLDVGPDRYAEAYHLFTEDGRPYPSEQLPLARAALHGERTVDARWRVRRPDGSEILAVGSAHPVLDADGQRVGAVLTLRDDTERRAAEAALFESEQSFRTFADTIPTLAWTARADGHIDWYNARWYAYTGTTPAEMEGWGWTSVHDPETLPQVLAGWTASVRSGEPFEMTFPLRGADGRFRAFLTRVMPVRDADGNITRWFGSNTDVERERASLAAAEAAAARTQRLQAWTADLAAAVTLEDAAGVIVSSGHDLGAATTALLVTLPETGEAMIIRSAGLDATMSDRYARFPLATHIPATECITRGVPVCVASHAELLERYPDGTDFWTLHDTQAIASVPLTVAGTVIGGMSFTYDRPREFSDDDVAFLVVIARQAAQAVERARLFAAEREARAGAERANRAKMEFLSTMSHELRTPLNAVGGYAELLAMGLRGPVTAAQLEDLERIRRAGQHLQSLINDVLNFAKIEAGRVEFDITVVPVEPLLASVEELVTPQLASRGLEYERQPPAGEARAAAIHADVEKVRQILLNLLSNAIRYAAEGRITMSYDTTADTVRLVVTDTGRGIPAGDLLRIFEPFVQVERNLAQGSQQGVGLGLAISRDLARAMGGDLTAESTLGVGSAFTLVLPSAPRSSPGQ